MRAWALLCVVWCVAGELDEMNKADLWVQALEECGNKGRDEDFEQAVLCQEEVERAMMSEEGVQGYKACDEQYCVCTGGRYESNGTGVCMGVDACREDCECMEQCYAHQMECSFAHTVQLYTTNSLATDHCAVAKMTNCVRNTRSAFVSECKRGLSQPRAFISWMTEPVPQGCNVELVCGSSSTLVASFSFCVLAVIAAII